LDPGYMREGSLYPVPNRYHCRCREQEPINVGARVSKAHPRLLRSCPLLPEPWICGAVVNLTGSKTPRPPRSIGRPTVDQLILQLPLVKLSSRDHKKHFLHPSMDCRISLGVLMIVRR
jgi:hypothetical protein